MPITVEWNNDNRSILTMSLVGKWTMQELFTAMDDMYGKIGDEDHDIYVVVDFTNGNSIPANALSIRGTIERKQPENQRFTVVTGTNMVIRTMINVIDKMMQRKDAFTYADTLDEAYAIVENKVAENIRR